MKSDHQGISMYLIKHTSTGNVLTRTNLGMTFKPFKPGGEHVIYPGILSAARVIHKFNTDKQIPLEDVSIVEIVDNVPIKEYFVNEFKESSEMDRHIQYENMLFTKAIKFNKLTNLRQSKDEHASIDNDTLEQQLVEDLKQLDAKLSEFKNVYGINKDVSKLNQLSVLK